LELVEQHAGAAAYREPEGKKNPLKPSAGFYGKWVAGIT
jgi:hypothetical protein